MSSVYGPEEQNLGWTREDDASTVSVNRQRFCAAAGAGDEFTLFTAGQIHSDHVLTIDELESGTVMTLDGRARLEGDGLISTRPGRLLGILTADCVPVLLADTRTHAVAAFHAGWRGTLARIVEQGVNSLRTRHGSQPEDLVAAIGPAIRACCFEVGDEVRSAFEAASPSACDLFHVPEASDGRGRPHLDLQEANRRQLLGVGLGPGQIQTIGECTACSRLADGRRKYFSYRAEGGVTGRMLSVIGSVQETAGH